MTALTVLQFLALVLVFQNVLTQDLTDEQYMEQLIGEHDKSVRPKNSAGDPVNVKINFYARDFYVMDRSMQYLGMQLTFRQEWKDPRLAYPNSRQKYHALTDVKSVWKPDVFFSNSRKGHFNDIMEPNTLIRIYPTGEVLYSTRVTMDFRCKTSVRIFPLNTVSCPVIIASYGYTTENIMLAWKSDNPVQMTKYNILSGYSIKLGDVDYCNSKTTTGEYSCLKVEFLLTPHYGSVFCLLYLPPLVLVLIGWLSFFLQRRNVKVRLPVLLVLLVLGALSIGNASRQSPDRLVLTAADVWSGLCLGFVLYALLHFILTRNVPCLAQACGYEGKNDDLIKPRCGDTAETQPMMPNDTGDAIKNKFSSKLQTTSARFRHLVTKSGNRADIAARILYPSAFIIANVVYWAIYNGEYV